MKEHLFENTSEYLLKVVNMKQSDFLLFAVKVSVTLCGHFLRTQNNDSSSLESLEMGSSCVLSLAVTGLNQ